jgi:hypothetical protein
VAWEDDLVRDYEHFRSKRIQGDELVKSRTVFLEKGAPSKWTELRSLFKDRMEKLNKAARRNILVWASPQSGEFVMLGEDGEELKGHFRTQSFSAIFSGDNCSACDQEMVLEVRAVNGTESLVWVDSTKRPVNAEWIAESLIGDFLRRKKK